MGRRRGQARLLAHVVAPAGRGARSALSGHQVRYRSGHRKRFLLRRRIAGDHHRERPAPDRAEDDRAFARQGAARAARGGQGGGPPHFHREGRPVQGRADLGTGGRHHFVLHERRLHRPLPRTPYPQHGLHQGRETHVGGRRLLARRREAPDAHAHLRHLVPQEVDARRVPRHDGGGQEARPPQARQGARTLHLLAARGPGPAPLAAQGRRAPRPPGAVPARRAEGVRLSAGHHAAHRQQGALRYVGPLRQVRQGLVPAHPHPHRGRGVPAQADELPPPLRNLPLEAPLVQGAAGAPGGVRHRVPLRAVGRTPRPDARAWIHAGRRPPLRAPRPAA